MTISWTAREISAASSGEEEEGGMLQTTVEMAALHKATPALNDSSGCGFKGSRKSSMLR